MTQKKEKKLTKTQERFVARVTKKNFDKKEKKHTTVSGRNRRHTVSKVHSQNEREIVLDGLVRDAQQHILEAVLAVAEDVAIQNETVVIAEDDVDVDAHSVSTKKPATHERAHQTTTSEITTKRKVRVPTPIDGIAVSDAVLHMSEEDFSVLDILCTITCREFGVHFTEEMRNEIHLGLKTRAWSIAAQIPQSDFGNASLEEIVSSWSSDFIRLRGVCREVLIGDIIRFNRLYPSQATKEQTYTALSTLFKNRTRVSTVRASLEKLLIAVQDTYLTVSEEKRTTLFNEEVIRKVCSERGLLCEEAIFAKKSSGEKKRKNGMLRAIFSQKTKRSHVSHAYDFPAHIELPLL